MRQQAKRREAPAGDGTKTPLDERIADEARFFKAWFENPAVTGAVSPSGRFLARAMAKFVDPDSHGPIVELGPGTGPVTQALLQRGVTPERLILVEYDTKFCRLLERRFPRCNVVQGDAYNLKRTLKGELDGKAAAREENPALAHLLAVQRNARTAADRLSAEGRGKTDPLVTTKDGVREPQNRRVEIVVQQ